MEYLIKLCQTIVDKLESKDTLTAIERDIVKAVYLKGKELNIEMFNFKENSIIPKVKILCGVIVSAKATKKDFINGYNPSFFPKFNNHNEVLSYVITIFDLFSNDIFEVYTTELLYELHNEVLLIDNAVNLIYEEHIAGITGFLNDSDSLVIDNHSCLLMKSVTSLPKNELFKLLNFKNIPYDPFWFFEKPVLDIQPKSASESLF